MEVLDFGMLVLGLDMSKASLRKHEATALDGNPGLRLVLAGQVQAVEC